MFWILNREIYKKIYLEKFQYVSMQLYFKMLQTLGLFISFWNKLIHVK